MKKKHKVDAFSLSFLDVMCCGFGAVILLVMILNGQTLREREEEQQDLQADLERVTLLKEFASDHFQELREQMDATELEEADLSTQANQLDKEIDDQQRENEQDGEEIQTREKTLDAMGDDIDALKKEVKNRKKQDKIRIATKAKPVGFDGDGRRQYLTGLKLRGDRTLILVDASASMLEETIVNIIHRSLMDDATRRNSPKWQRVVRSLHWLVANLPEKKSFQVYYFNTQAHPAMAGTGNRWLSTSDETKLSGTIDAISQLAPLEGTNLVAAFDVIKQLHPKPDSVLLLTDGLPTQGRSRQIPNTVSANERLVLFNEAVSSLLGGVPINTLLFPLEGDPRAAFEFWKLAVNTKGSFITPSRDWP